MDPSYDVKLILLFSEEPDLNTIFGDKLIQEFHASIPSRTSHEDDSEYEDNIKEGSLQSIDPNNLEPEVSLKEDNLP